MMLFLFSIQYFDFQAMDLLSKSKQSLEQAKSNFDHGVSLVVKVVVAGVVVVAVVEVVAV